MVGRSTGKGTTGAGGADRTAEYRSRDIDILSDELAAADVKLTAAKTEDAALTGQLMLRRFLTAFGRRDYDSYRGVVALAHRDLEQLGSYLERRKKTSATMASRCGGSCCTWMTSIVVIPRRWRGCAHLPRTESRRICRARYGSDVRSAVAELLSALSELAASRTPDM